MLVGGPLYLSLLGRPLLLFPMAWARGIGWEVPQETDLADYLGRVPGWLSLPLVIIADTATLKPWEYRFVFDMVILVGQPI